MQNETRPAAGAPAAGFVVLHAAVEGQGRNPRWINPPT